MPQGLAVVELELTELVLAGKAPQLAAPGLANLASLVVGRLLLMLVMVAAVVEVASNGTLRFHEHWRS